MAKLFFSYSHDDEEHRNQLEKHLTMLKREGLIESWHDRRILAGTPIDQEIDRHLEEADVVLLLISSSFLASEYCYGIEMRRALERHQTGKVRVIPVVVRPCDWHSAPFGKLMAAPRDGKPIVTWPNYDEAYADVARQVRAVVEAETKGRDKRGASHKRAAPEKSSPATPAARQLPRSSNMRLRKEFTEAEKDSFLHDAYEHMASFFDGSLAELQARHSGVECRFRRVDANTFTATIYRGGQRKAECAIRLGGSFRNGGITYSSDASGRGNSYNEQLTVDNDDQSLFLRPLGLAFHHQGEAKLSAEQGAEFFWEILVEPLQ